MTEEEQESDPFANMVIGSDDCEQGRHTQCKSCPCTCHPKYPQVVTGTPLSRLGQALEVDWADC